jgi:hypothetical protein
MIERWYDHTQCKLATCVQVNIYVRTILDWCHSTLSILHSTTLALACSLRMAVSSDLIDRIKHGLVTQAQGTTKVAPRRMCKSTLQHALDKQRQLATSATNTVSV